MMKKTKHSVVPVPGSKSKGQPKPNITLSKAHLSQEYVGSSDDSGVDEIPSKKTSAKPVEPAKPKPTVSIGVHRANGIQKKTQVPIPTSKPTPGKAVGKAVSPSAGSSSSSEAESGSESADVEEQNKANGTQKTTGKESSKRASSSDSSESSSSESESEEEEEPAPREPQPQEKPRPAQQHAVETRQAQPYVPPENFKAIATPLRPNSTAVEMFESLAGKQLWHITTRDGVSLLDLPRDAVEKAMQAEAVLRHNSIEYGFSTTENDEGAIKEVLLPRSNGYKAVSSRITRTLQLQQVVQLPNLSSRQADQNTGSEAAASITQSTIRAPRPQVKGLKMRFKLSGFGPDEPGTLGSSDTEEEAPAPAGLAVPNGLPILNKPEKRRHDDSNEGGESPTKKHKKHRTPEELKKREEKKAKKREKQKTK